MCLQQQGFVTKRHLACKMKASLVFCSVISLTLGAAVSVEVCGKLSSNAKQFPWNVGIYVENANSNLDVICLGTLIDPNIVLTTAHCFWDPKSGDLKDNNYYIAVGELEKSSQGKNLPNLQKISNKNIFIHKEFAGIKSFFEYNVAIVKLEQNLKLSETVSPACIDFANSVHTIKENEVGKLPVWDGNAVKVVDLPHINYDQCVSISHTLGWNSFVTNDKICTKSSGVKVTEESTGSGLVYRQEDGLWYVMGILSSQDAKNHEINVYTKVNRHLNWIAGICAKIRRNI